jgi:hypothetical protein
MIDPCVPVWCWLVAGEDAVWFARHTYAALTPAEIGFDVQDMDVCMLRCEVALWVYHEVDNDDEGTTTQLICGYPVQCAAIAAPDAAGRVLCADHREDGA